LRAEAEGYRSRIIAQAEGDAQRFRQVLNEYQKAPGVTRDRMYIDAMQQVYSNVSKVLVDSRNNSNLLYLPLDKLIQQTAAASTSSSTGSNAAPTGSTPPDTVGPSTVVTPDARSRDGRGRDREGR